MDELLNQYPRAIEAFFVNSVPNEPIALYNGPISLLIGSKEYLTNDGQIELSWFPTPAIGFQASFSDVSPLIELGPILLRIDSLSLVLNARITSYNHNMSSGTKPFELRFQGFIERFPAFPITEFKEVLLHLTNFHDNSGDVITGLNRQETTATYMGRLAFNANPWKLTIDKLPSGNSLIGALRQLGGYAVTHVGRLERLDNSSLNVQEAQNAIDMLHYFFALIRGEWCGPLLPVFMTTERNILQKWEVRNLSPWRTPVNWFPYNQPPNTQYLDRLFEGFLSKWNEPLWQSSLRFAIHWYVEAGSASIEAGIILTATALELLFWTYFVEDNLTSKFSSNQVQNNYRSLQNKLSQMLEAVNLPLEIPDYFEELEELRTILNIQENNGPTAFTKIRNQIVHMNRSDRERLHEISPNARFQAKQLGLWYLEVFLLYALNYNGTYLLRDIKKQLSERINRVPWVN